MDKCHLFKYCADKSEFQIIGPLQDMICHNFQNCNPTSIMIYKLYVRPHLDYGDIIYHKYDPEFKLDFTKRLESTQYSAALAVSGAW